MGRKKVKLKRHLGLVQLTLAGVGIILGAGIYALLGVASVSSGNALWLSFLISAVVALFTGLSYAELSSRFSGDAGEYDYIRSALHERLAFLVSFAMVFTGAVAAAAVALGFAGYFVSLVSVPYVFAALGIVLFMGLLNFMGIKEVALFVSVSTIIEFLGLVVIVVLALPYFGSVNYLSMPSGVSGLFSSAALVFFAYIGFESLIKFREETKMPAKTVPLAIVFSVIIATILYILVAIAAVSVLPWEELAASSAPLADVVSAVLPGSFVVVALALIALFSTSNTVLLSMVAGSRQLYGLAQ